jgi:hypothetical protein
MPIITDYKINSLGEVVAASKTDFVDNDNITVKNESNATQELILLDAAGKELEKLARLVPNQTVDIGKQQRHYGRFRLMTKSNPNKKIELHMNAIIKVGNKLYPEKYNERNLNEVKYMSGRKIAFYNFDASSPTDQIRIGSIPGGFFRDECGKPVDEKTFCGPGNHVFVIGGEDNKTYKLSIKTANRNDDCDRTGGDGNGNGDGDGPGPTTGDGEIRVGSGPVTGGGGNE